MLSICQAVLDAILDRRKKKLEPLSLKIERTREGAKQQHTKMKMNDWMVLYTAYDDTQNDKQKLRQRQEFHAHLSSINKKAAGNKTHKSKKKLNKDDFIF